MVICAERANPNRDPGVNPLARRASTTTRRRLAGRRTALDGGARACKLEGAPWESTRLPKARPAHLHQIFEELLGGALPRADEEAAHGNHQVAAEGRRARGWVGGTSGVREGRALLLKSGASYPSRHAATPRSEGRQSQAAPSHCNAKLTAAAARCPRAAPARTAPRMRAPWCAPRRRRTGEGAGAGQWARPWAGRAFPRAGERAPIHVCPPGASPRAALPPGARLPPGLAPENRLGGCEPKL